MFKNGTICVTNIQIKEQNLPRRQKTPAPLLLAAARVHDADFKRHRLAPLLFVLYGNGVLQQALFGVPPYYNIALRRFTHNVACIVEGPFWLLRSVPWLE